MMSGGSAPDSWASIAKKSVTMDLRNPTCKAAFETMVSSSDVLVDNWEPGALGRLGLGYSRLQHVNRGLVYATITGYGDNEDFQGPYSSWPANNLCVQAMGGCMGITGNSNAPAQSVGENVGDSIPGLWTALAIVLALETRRKTGQGQHVDMAMQVAQEGWLKEICQYCSDRDIRLFNDAAYIILSHGPDSAALSQVAVDFPDLSWAEAFTAAKLIGNGTGWHIGAMVGSPDFIADLKEVKGKTDAGFVAPMAAGVEAAFLHDQEGIQEYCEMYHRRLNTLIESMGSQGMRLAIEPVAGFFTLWLCPTHAFGQKIKDAREFNFKMIDETGLVGVHFSNYLRYAVCDDVEAMAQDIEAAFKKAQVSFN